MTPKKRAQLRRQKRKRAQQALVNEIAARIFPGVLERVANRTIANVLGITLPEFEALRRAAAADALLRSPTEGLDVGS